MMFWRALSLCAAFFVLSSQAASAQDGRWLRAESENFIVYGAVNEVGIRQAAQKLEDFHQVLRALTNAQARPTEAKLEVYLVRNAAQLRSIAPGLQQGALGFYRASAEQIAAFTIYGGNDYNLDSDTVLFHEYAHHFMLHYFPYAYPSWYVEGWAEYVSTAEIRGRRVSVGQPSEARSASIVHEGILPIESLLAPDRARNDAAFMSRFYATAWFAVHYMSNHPEMQSRLPQYLDALGNGADAIEAFEPAFGMSPAEFRRELEAFRRGRVTARNFMLPETLAEVSVTRLPDAADDLLLQLPRLRSSAAGADQAQYAAEIERLAARHPGDIMAQIAATRASMLREDWQTARDRVTAILATDETNTEARYLLAQTKLHEADAESDAERRLVLIREARRELARGFRNDPNHFPTLFTYALTFSGGAEPMSNENLDVLARSLELAPQAEHIRLTTARELMVAGEFDTAIVILRPLIYAPHGGRNAEYARALFDAARQRQPPPAYVEEDEEEAPTD